MDVTTNPPSKLEKLRALPLNQVPGFVVKSALGRLTRGWRSSIFALSDSLGNSQRKLQVRGINIILGVGSEIEHYRAQSFETKEPETLDWIDEEFKPGEILYDIGANVGVYTLYASLKNPRGQVYSFEPECQNFARLCKNLWANKINNVIPCNFALSEKTEANHFYVSAKELGSSMHSFGRVSEYQGARPVALKQGVFGVSLDELVSKFDYPQPTLLKIDVDGLEPEILAGARRTLEHSKLRSVLVELSQSHKKFDSIMNDLSQLGFQLHRKSNWIYQEMGQTMQNYIFKK